MIKMGFWFPLGMYIPSWAYKLKKNGFNSNQGREINEYREIGMRGFEENTSQGRD